jgi:hypothetical protein
MARKKSPWPKGLRIDPENDPLAALPDDHPAKRVLIARAICQRDCAGREIEFLGQEGQAFDQVWQSAVDGRPRRFSEFVYEFVCFDLILTEWLERPPVMTASEREALAEFPRLQALLAECRAAATAEQNQPVLEALPKAEAFVAAWEASIRARLTADRIPLA